MPLSDVNWKTKMIVGGVALGAGVGLATAYLLSRTIEERGGDTPDINTMDALNCHRCYRCSQRNRSFRLWEIRVVALDGDADISRRR